MPLQMVCRERDLNEGEGKTFEVSGKKIALFRESGKFFAIDNTCPHMGGPLGEGLLEGGTVTCPWHGWQFDIKAGRSPVMPSACVATYPVSVKDGAVFVDL